MNDNPKPHRMLLSGGVARSASLHRSSGAAVREQHDSSEPTDEQLVAAAQAGVSSALEKLLLRHQTVVYAMARRFSNTAEDADDLVQETMLRAIKNIRTFRSEARFSSWLVAIVANTAISMKRSQRNIHWVYLNDGWPQSDDATTTVVLPDLRRNPEQEYLRNEMQFMVRNAVARQHANFRLVLRTCCIDEMPVEDAARELGISLPAAKSRLFRARKMLSRTLQKRMRRNKQ